MPEDTITSRESFLVIGPRKALISSLSQAFSEYSKFISVHVMLLYSGRHRRGSRHGTATSTSTSRSYMAMQPFMFMSLPLELRLEVYKILLQIGRGGSCYPQILATCRDIHKEAMHLLYSLNLVRLVIRPSGISGIFVYPVNFCSPGPHRARVRRIISPKIKNTILENPFQSTVLGRCQQISIDIGLGPLNHNIEKYEELRRTMRWVCNALSANASLKSVRVDDTTRVLYEVIKETSLPIGFLLSPLRTIRGLEEVSIISPKTPTAMVDLTALVMLGPRHPPE